MKHWIRSWFSMDRAERNGVSLVVGILLLANVVIIIRQEYLRSGQSDALKVVVTSMQPDPVPSAPTRAVFSEFDPDTLDAQEWQALGFSERQSGTIIKFRGAVGGFHDIHTLAKCFVIDAAFIEEFGPLMRFREVSTASLPRPMAFSEAEDESFRVDLATADTAQLMRLKGIGPVLARRIVAYRNLLGGFYHKSQLEEVYGVDPELVERLSPQLFLSTFQVKRLDLERATISSLSRHPYISKQKAARIIELTAHVRDCKHLLDSLNFAPDERERIGNYLHLGGACR